MRITVFAMLTILIQRIVFAQSPVVPHRMTIGDVKLKITDGARAEIQKNVNELTKNPKYFNAKVDLANQYFHFIEEAFKKENIPEDIKYLAIQESGLISDVVSSSNAVGYWQFKDFTAVEMGLRVDKHVDERKNIYAASIGAAKYLKTNNKLFDNWIFAIQAYQMGAGGALKVTDKKLYGAKQMTITKKTYWYVKKYLAHKVAYESAVGKSRPSLHLSAYKSGEGKTLNEISKKFKVNLEELKKYNKWIKKGKIPSDKKYAVIIPNKQLIKISDNSENSFNPKIILVKKTPSYNQLQAKLFPKIKPWKGSSKYAGSTVNVNKLPGVLGENNNKLSDLARKGNVSLSDFLNINDIEIDHKVVESVPYYFKKKKAKAKVYYHVAHDKETLWSISQKYGVQLKKLLMKNRIDDVKRLKEGRVLWMRHIRSESIPITFEEIDDIEPIEITLNENNKPETVVINKTDSIEQPDIAVETENIPNNDDDVLNKNDFKELMHIVKSGDTYYSIANKYKVQVLKLVEWNQLVLTDKLSIDQQLIIYIPNETLKSSENDDIEIINPKEYHIVEKGDTLFNISVKYGISLEKLREINNKINDELALGEKLKVISDR